MLITHFLEEKLTDFFVSGQLCFIETLILQMANLIFNVTFIFPVTIAHVKQLSRLQGSLTAKLPKHVQLLYSPRNTKCTIPHRLLRNTVACQLL